MPHKIQKIIFSVLGLVLFVLAGCENRAPEISGIVAISSIETVACQPRTKTFKIRNNNDAEPQRVQGVLFELGTNEQKFFKILTVTVGSSIKKVVGNLEEEILLPPGGMMEVKVQYNPKETTAEGEHHDTYLDVVLNGPKMGVMQIEIDGTAPTALPGCKNDTSGGRVFKVLEAKTVLSHKDIGEKEQTLEIGKDVVGDLILNGPDDAIKILPEGWPTIDFPLPAGATIPDLKLTLEEETGTADFTSGKLKIDNVSINAGGIEVFDGLTLTTGNITIDNTEAPNIFGDSISFDGSDLDSEGKMTLVIAAPLTRPAVENQEKVGKGVFGLYLTVQEVK